MGKLPLRGYELGQLSPFLARNHEYIFSNQSNNNMCELGKVTFPVPQFPLEEDLPLWDFHCFAKAKYFELSVLRHSW